MKIKEMTDEITNLYNDNRWIMQKAKITKQTFFSWLDSFKTHEDIRRAHRFAFGTSGSDIGTKVSFNRKVSVANEVFTLFKPEGWDFLFATTPNQNNVVMMRQACMQLKKVWLSRPKKNRGQE